MPVCDGIHVWRRTPKSAHRAQVPFVGSMLSIALRVGDDYTLGQMKLAAEHYDLRVFPGVVTYSRSPVGYADVAVFEFPTVFGGELLGLLEAFIAAWPVRNVLLSDELLVANHQ